MELNDVQLSLVFEALGDVDSNRLTALQRDALPALRYQLREHLAQNRNALSPSILEGRVIKKVHIEGVNSWTLEFERGEPVRLETELGAYQIPHLVVAKPT